MNQVVGSADLLFVTFDSLRWDVAARAFAAGRTPHLARWIGSAGWEKRETPGTFTLAAHTAFFHGFLPTPIERPDSPRLFALEYVGARTIGPGTRVFKGVPDVVRGLAAEGYLTLCVGGVGFFSRRNPLGSVLPGYFQESVWEEAMGPAAPGSTARQVAWALERLARVERGRRVFLFINVSATHAPHHFYLPGSGGTDSPESQAAALAYADGELAPLVEAMAARAPLFALAMADHGEAMGEDGRWGHRIAHPTVTTVPYAEFQLGLALPGALAGR